MLEISRNIALAPPKYRGTTLDKRLDAFSGILAVENTVLDLWNVTDSWLLATFDVFQCGLP